jgi:hypothetical protein
MSNRLDPSETLNDVPSKPGLRFDPWLIPAVALALMPILTIAQPGIPLTADGYVHILRTLEVSELLRDGVLLPGWAPHFYLGYGYPFFIFYAAGAHLLAGLAALAGLGVLRGVVAVQVIALLLYPTGAYLAARTLFTTATTARFARPAALLSAALYLYAPLRFRELFVQGNLSQLLALALLPWCAWLLTEAILRGDLRRSAAAGLALAALVYAHHPSAFLGFPFLAVYALALALIVGRTERAAIRRGQRAEGRGQSSVVSRQSSVRSPQSAVVSRQPSAVGGRRSVRPAPPHPAWLMAVLPFVLSVLLSAAFWLPSVAELGYVNIAAIESGMFNARLNLLPLDELLSPARVLDDTVLNPPQPNSLGLIQAVLAVAGLAVALAWARRGVLEPGRILRLRPPNDSGLRSGCLRLESKSHPQSAAVGGRQRSAVGRRSSTVVDRSSVVGGRRSAAVGGQPSVVGRRSSAVGSRRSAAVGGQPSVVGRRSAAVGLSLLAAAGLLVVCLVLMQPTAAPVWEHLPLARFIAFPWRLLGPALLWAALLGGAALFVLPQRARQPGLLALLVLVPLSVAPYLFPRPFAAVGEPSLADLARYELEGGARATASANEYLPRWVADPDLPAEMAEAMREGRPIDRLDRTTLPPGSRVISLASGPLEDAYRIELPQASTVRLRRFFFPGWRGWVDGQSVTLTASAPFGLIEIAVPTGAHEMRVQFGPTPARSAGGFLALIGLGGTLGAWLWGRRRRHGSSARRTDATVPAPSAGWAPALAAILALTAVTILGIGPHTRWFRQRSPVAAPAAMQHPVHAMYANGIELIGYDLSDEAPRQGDTLRVRLYWRTLEPQGADVRPFLHLDAITGEQTWANQTKMHAGDKPVSDWPAGFYVVDDYNLMLPKETPPVVADLAAGWVDARGERVPLLDGGDRAIFAQLHVRERSPLSVRTLPGRAETYRLGDVVQLVGHAVAVTQAAGGEAGGTLALDVALYWQASGQPGADYTVFVHVLDEEGRRIAQEDGPPVSHLYPTSAWTPGQVILDRRRVPLPDGIAAGYLSVAVGLYTPADGTRLPVTDRRGVRLPDDQILISPQKR